MLVYDPVKQIAISPNKRQIEFFCGQALDDIASIVLGLEFGLVTPQAAYVELLKTRKTMSFFEILNLMSSICPVKCETHISWMCGEIRLQWDFFIGNQRIREMCVIHPLSDEHSIRNSIDSAKFNILHNVDVARKNDQK